MKINIGLLILVISIISSNCKEQPKSTEKKSEIITKKTRVKTPLITTLPEGVKTPEGKVWIAGGSFSQGAVDSDKMAMHNEKPSHLVAVNGFFIDVNEVTNAQFSKFVEETGYLTIAERKIDWEEMKTQLPEGTPKPHDSILQPGSLVFRKTTVNNLQDYSQWWKWTIGTNWKHPEGPNSSIKGKENHPVVHIAYDDAIAYCKWSETRLPTEAEWEYAARGGQKDKLYFWGNDSEVLAQSANTWTGDFPRSNDTIDGFERTAPVKSYPPNSYGLYDMAGNVWEWTSDWYNSNYYKEQYDANEVVVDPKGPAVAYNSANRLAKEKIMKGGSFLCSETYCASYRISARMATSLDSSMEHLGFRTVKSLSLN